MNKKSTMFPVLLAVICLIGVMACSKKEDSVKSNEKQPKFLYTAASFAYPSLDAHKEYYGWYTSIYGITETLFRLDDTGQIQPWLAEGGTVEGNVWTITLKDGICFSNGELVDAAMVIRNLNRAAEVNRRFAYMGGFTYTVLDEQTFTIGSESIFPTMLNSLTCPELAILYLDENSDYDRAITGTGPFRLEHFEPEGTVSVVRNEQYWDGAAALDGAVFYYLQDDDSKLLAMQNGEIDGYNSVTAAAAEIFAASPDEYSMFSVPATRLQFYIVNHLRLEQPVREAIALTIDGEAMSQYLAGTVTPTAGPFAAAAPYGRAQQPQPDLNAAGAILEAAGYSRNAAGFYERDGAVLTVEIAYYPARSLDTVAAVLQEQLGKLGIQAVLTSVEDPDATYIASRDFDLALYCMIADTSGDPQYFITSTLQDGSYFDVGGFDNPRCEELISQLILESDPDKRALLANEIVQISIDEQALGYLALFNKVTVLRDGVSGFAEHSPYDFYGLSAATDKRE